MAIRKFRVIDIDDASSIDFDEVCTTSIDTARKNDAEGKFIVKWDAPDNDPDFVPASVASVTAIQYGGRDDHDREQLDADVLSQNEWQQAQS